MQAEAGDVTGALATAIALPEEHWRGDALAEIVHAHDSGR